MKADRIKAIKELLLSNRKVLNTELCDRFKVSIETVRRDLKQLERQGIIRRVYGGAVLTENSAFPDTIDKWQVRSMENISEKRTIASQTAQLIPDNCTVLLDSGTSAFEIACLLKGRQNLTVITYSLRIATELGMCPNLTVYCVGGIIKVDALVTTGFLAAEFLSYFSHLDYAVISGDGFIPAVGTTEYAVEMAMLKRNIIPKADRVLLAIDHTKFGIAANCVTCETSKIHTVITDRDAPGDAVAYLRSMGVDVLVADSSKSAE